jgi:hypothetical protein
MHAFLSCFAAEGCPRRAAAASRYSNQQIGPQTAFQPCDEQYNFRVHLQAWTGREVENLLNSGKFGLAKVAPIGLICISAISPFGKFNV